MVPTFSCTIGIFNLRIFLNNELFWHVCWKWSIPFLFLLSSVLDSRHFYGIHYFLFVDVHMHNWNTVFHFFIFSGSQKLFSPFLSQVLNLGSNHCYFWFWYLFFRCPQLEYLICREFYWREINAYRVESCPDFSDLLRNCSFQFNFTG